MIEILGGVKERVIYKECGVGVEQHRKKGKQDAAKSSNDETVSGWHGATSGYAERVHFATCTI